MGTAIEKVKVNLAMKGGEKCVANYQVMSDCLLD